MTSKTNFRHIRMYVRMFAYIHIYIYAYVCACICVQITKRALCMYGWVNLRSFVNKQAIRNIVETMWLGDICSYAHSFDKAFYSVSDNTKVGPKWQLLVGFHVFFNLETYQMTNTILIINVLANDNYSKWYEANFVWFSAWIFSPNKILTKQYRGCHG